MKRKNSKKANRRLRPEMVQCLFDEEVARAKSMGGGRATKEEEQDLTVGGMRKSDRGKS